VGDRSSRRTVLPLRRPLREPGSTVRSVVAGTAVTNAYCAAALVNVNPAQLTRPPITNLIVLWEVCSLLNIINLP